MLLNNDDEVTCPPWAERGLVQSDSEPRGTEEGRARVLLLAAQIKGRWDFISNILNNIYRFKPSAMASVLIVLLLLKRKPAHALNNGVEHLAV